MESGLDKPGRWRYHGKGRMRETLRSAGEPASAGALPGAILPALNVRGRDGLPAPKVGPRRLPTGARGQAVQKIARRRAGKRAGENEDDTCAAGAKAFRPARRRFAVGGCGSAAAGLLSERTHPSAGRESARARMRPAPARQARSLFAGAAALRRRWLRKRGGRPAFRTNPPVRRAGKRAGENEAGSCAAGAKPFRRRGGASPSVAAEARRQARFPNEPTRPQGGKARGRE